MSVNYLAYFLTSCIDLQFTFNNRKAFIKRDDSDSTEVALCYMADFDKRESTLNGMFSLEPRPSCLSKVDYSCNFFNGL